MGGVNPYFESGGSLHATGRICGSITTISKQGTMLTFSDFQSRISQPFERVRSPEFDTIGRSFYSLG